MTNSRDQFIETTCRLLEIQGYHATGLNQIIQESGAPKGSLYYHFPGGKEELAEEAIRRTGSLFAQIIQTNFREGIPLAEAVREFVLGIAGGVKSSNFSAGGPLTTIAMETATTNERLNQACRQAFGQIQAAFSEKLTKAGIHSQQANQYSILITSAIEGGILLSRTNHDTKPLVEVAELLHLFLEAK